jgi:plasmid stability protein
MRKFRNMADSAGKGTSCCCHSERSEESMQREDSSKVQRSFAALRTTFSCAIIDCNAIIDCMASITIRNLEESTKRKLKVRAAVHGRSMEQEAREILKNALRSAPQKQGNLAERIRAIWEPLGGVDLAPYPRQPMRDPEWLKDWK